MVTKSSVTVREVREKYLEKHNLKKISSENKETFRTLVDIVLQEIPKQDKEEVSEPEPGEDDEDREASKEEPEPTEEDEDREASKEEPEPTEEDEDREASNKSEQKKKSRKLMSLEEDFSDLDEHSPLKYDVSSDSDSDSYAKRRIKKLKSQLLVCDDSDIENSLSEAETVKRRSDRESEDEFLKLEKDEVEPDVESKDSDDLIDSGTDPDLDDKVQQKITRNLTSQGSYISECNNKIECNLNTEHAQKDSGNVELIKSEDDSDCEDPEAISRLTRAVFGDDNSQMSQEESEEGVDVKSFYKRKPAASQKKLPSVPKMSELSDSESDEFTKNRIQMLKSIIAEENFERRTSNSNAIRKKNLSRVNNKKRQLSSSSHSDNKVAISRMSPLKSDKKVLKRRKIEKKRPSCSEFSSDEENVPLVKVAKQINAQINIKQEIDSDSDVKPLNDTGKQKRIKKDRESDFTDSDSKPLKELNSSNQKKNSRKKKSGKVSETTSKEKKEDPKIERLKRYIRTAGLRVVYIKVFENCERDKQKVQKLLEILQDAGIKGTPTLEKCKSLRKKRETAKELDELDTSNIINTEGRSCRSKAATPRQTPDNTSAKGFKPKFSRLKDIVDSEESD